MRIESPITNYFYSFRDIFEAVASKRSFEDLLDVILSTSLRELQADQGSLLLLQGQDRSGESLKMLASRGLPEEIVRRGYVPRRGSVSEYVIRERTPVIINDEPATGPYVTLKGESTSDRQICSALCVPLISRGNVLGTMNLNRIGRIRSQFLEQDLEVCVIVAGQAAIVIEHKRLQEELIQCERLAAVGQTVAGISHCVKNMLGGVNGGIDLTEMAIEQNNAELLRQGFGLLKQSSGKLAHLVLDLLDYAKERQPARRWFNIDRVINEVLESAEPLARQLGVRLEAKSDNSLRYYGDPDQIFRALLNIITNAIEASAEKAFGNSAGLVVIEASTVWSSTAFDTKLQDPQNKFIAVKVRDNGAGIAEDVKDQIWELFYSTKGSKGTGIGLAATRKMIEEHGGNVRIASTANTGTTFEILLPLSVAPSDSG